MHIFFFSFQDKNTFMKTLRHPSELQLKLEKQLAKSRQVCNGIVKYERIPIPGSAVSSKDYKERMHLFYRGSSSEEEELMQEVDLTSPVTDKVVIKQPTTTETNDKNKVTEPCTQQLLYDGYRLDEISDDEDLDLIPPQQGGYDWCLCSSDRGSCVLQ